MKNPPRLRGIRFLILPEQFRAAEALGVIDQAIASVTSQRVDLGAMQAQANKQSTQVLNLLR